MPGRRSRSTKRLRVILSYWARIEVRESESQPQSKHPTHPDQLALQFFRDHFVYQLRIGLPLRRLHHLPHEKSEHSLFPCAILLDLLRIRCDQFIGELFEG